MQLRAREMQIPEEEPFRYDALNRIECAEALRSFVCSSSGPMIICLDALWGQGKTTFLKMWTAHLRNYAIPVAYYNAWENIVSEQPVLSLLGELDALKESHFREDNVADGEAAFQKVLDAAIPFVDVSRPIEQTKENSLDLRQQIQQYGRKTKSVPVFQSALAEYVSLLSQEDERYPLVFIIDELERCAPQTAIAVLETIRHLFAVENLVFVLGLDKTQMASSLKTVYGAGLHSEGYFQRLIDIEYRLPDSFSDDFIQTVFEEYGFLTYFSASSPYFQRLGLIALQIFSDLFAVYSLTLREQRNACQLLSLVIHTTENKGDLHPIFLVFLIVFKVKSPDEYQDFVSGDISSIELVLRFRKDVHGGGLTNDFCVALEAYIFSCRAESYQEVLDESRRFFSEHSIERVFLEFQRIQREKGIGILMSLASKLEIISRFKDRSW